MLWRDNEGKNQVAESSSSNVNKENKVDNQGRDLEDKNQISAKEQLSMYLNLEGAESYEERVELIKKQVEELKRQKREIDKRKELIEKEREAEARRRAIYVAKQRRKERRQLVIEQQRDLQRRLRAESIAEEKRLKNELSDLKKKEKKEKYENKSEIKRQKKLAEKSASMGGGIVNVHGTTVATEIRPVAKVSLRDFLGFGAKKARKAASTDEEMAEAQKLREQRKEQARLIAAQISKLQWERRRNSFIGMKISSFLRYCDEKKKILFVFFSIILTLAVITAGIFNYLTIFEYSYNGKALGYVKDREDVIKVTQLVRNALSEDIDTEVVIDPKSDISFSRKLTIGHEYTQDSTDIVLKRLSYMGNLDVKAYGIFVDGLKIGAVESKEVVANVLEGIERRYASKKKGSEIKSAVIVEDVKVKMSDTPLNMVLDENEMIEALCVNRDRETVYTVKKGDTIASIAEKYNIPDESLIAANDGLQPDDKLNVGSTIVIKENAPALTVKIKELRSYEKTIKYETQKVDDKSMYKGDSEVKQKGKDGKSEIVDLTESVNGVVVSTENIETVVKKEPVTKIINVGTKKRPPTVGCGKFDWPADKNSFTVTSEFKWRWGRQHQGMDLGCPIGTDVLAADGGTVTYSGYMGGYGYLVIIDHQNGMESYYGHNNSLVVKVGDKVHKGQHIAESGNTGRSTGPHIHFGVKVDGTFVNPRDYM